LKKITLIVHDLSSNPIVRAYPLALALQRLGYKIEVVGFLIGKNQVYPPYADKFEYKTVFIKGGIFSYLIALPKILKLIKGDIIYAFKPIMTSFFVGLLKSWFGLKKTLILDAEDDELYFKYTGFLNFIYLFFIRGINNPNAHRNLLLLNLFLFPAKIRTVVSSKLQKRYGGEILLHGPDETIFNPSKFNKTEARENLNLPQDKILILFAGVPHEHKGINTIIKTLHSIQNDKFIFVGAGPSNHEWFERAKSNLGDRCILLGYVPNNKMPLLLAAIDIVPILQRKTKFTESQIPAKLLEAMAMEKIIIATYASDIGKILGNNEIDKRGFIIDYDNADQLTEILFDIRNNPKEGLLMGKRARNYFLKEASIAANTLKFNKYLEKL